MIAYLLPCLFLLIPVVLCAAAIHWCERTTQRQLSARFGWNSVLWTGWLGTPIHESSHALVCPIFRHRIDEIAFFQPDRKSGRLGYVRHSFHQGNWFEEMGNLFIGVAPLVGGSLVLLALLYLFYPESAAAAFAATASAATSADASGMPAPHGDVAAVWHSLSRQTIAMFGELFHRADWATPRWWIFLYLVLCVGSHMAPSRSDYAGSRRGALITVGLFAVILVVLTALQIDASAFTRGVLAVGAPLLSVLALATALCVLSTCVVVAVTSWLPVRAPR